MNKLNTKGFGVIQIVVVVLVAATVAAVGYSVYQSNQETESPSPSQQTPVGGDPDGCSRSGICPDKPVIYLYPTKTQDVAVQLDYSGALRYTYPGYNYDIGGWQVTAQPDGTLANKADGKEYSYLFWEGVDQTEYDLSSGFVVKGSDTQAFLQKTLSEIGLTPKEYNEMIVYWVPRMQNNPYNLIHFAGKQYTDTAKLTVTPTPDSVLRVFMVYKPLDKPTSVEPQTFPAFIRNGFTVVEWGGAEVRP